MASTLSTNDMQQLMQMAGPTVVAATRRFTEQFNKVCMQFLGRLQKWSPATAVDSQQAINEVLTADNTDYHAKPMEKFYEVCKPLAILIAKRDDAFIMTHIHRLNIFHGIDEQWGSLPSDTKMRIWGYITKLLNIAREHEKMEAESKTVLHESFQNATKMITEFEAHHGRKMQLSDMSSVFGMQIPAVGGIKF